MSPADTRPEPTPMEDPMTDNRPTDPVGTDGGAEDPGTTVTDEAATEVFPTTDTGTGTADPGSAPQSLAPETSTQVQPAPAPAPHQDRGPRVGTVVWGLVVAAIGVGLLAVALGVVFDVELAFIVLVAAAGVLLLVGSVFGARRRRR